MTLFTISKKLFAVILCMIGIACLGNVYAQVSNASISQVNSNRLVVNLSSRTTISNAEGWYLIGGGTEIKRLVGGSGTSTLTFELTDYALPDDNFTLSYYEELGNAVSNGAKTRSAEGISVSNEISSYRGSGTLYYVSRSGSSGASGTSSSQPTTFSRAISRASAGDYVLLKKGESWSSPLKIKDKRGTADRYLTIGTYGSGSKPVISGDATSIELRDSYYVQVVGLEARPTSGSRIAGVRILGNSRYCKARSLKVIGPKKYSDGTGEGSGISYSSQSGAGKFPYHSVVTHCEVSGFKDGIYGYGIEGGGSVCFNKVSYCSEDGIRAFEGDAEGIVIGHNRITKFSDDGIDLYNGSNIILQYNEIYDPVSPRPNNANNGIKGGGPSKSKDIIIRYNTIYDIYARSGRTPHAITTNGSTSGEIYGNLCYNIDDNAIEITASQRNKSWKVHHNTAISRKAHGLYIAPNNPDVKVYNNILRGAISDIRVNGNSSAKGGNNVLINNKKSGNYSGSGDFSASTSALFVNYERNDFRLKDSSPAINKGASIGDYELDIRGKGVTDKHDIGSYEYGNGTPPKRPADPTPKPEPSPKPSPTPTAGSGLRYQYYEGEWHALPDFSGLSVKKQGKVANFSLAPRARNDNFGMVFEGQIKIDRSGEYTFYTNSDDGVRLFVKGQRVVNDDGEHSARERSGKISLSTGLHTIRVEYFERLGREVLEVSYQGLGVKKQRIPDNKLFPPDTKAKPKPSPPPSASAGLRYQYYEGKWRTLPSFSSQSVKKQGRVANFSLAPRARDENFGMVFEGQIKIDRSGQYTFYTTADDGVRLFVKGQRVVNDDGIHAARERSGSISLSAGLHPIRVEYFERTAKEVLEVRYKGPGVSKQRIPDGKLFQAASNQRVSAASTKKDAGVSDKVIGEDVAAYPNPLQDELTIELPTVTKELEIELVNSVGAVVWYHDIPEADTRFSLNVGQVGLTPGYYLLVIRSQNEVLYSSKVLKK